MSIIDNFAKFSFCIEVSADFAEFTSKKDQRISYAVPTSGAIRGLLQAIFWKPAIKYIPRKVEVLNPIRRMDIKKNELKKWCNDDNTPMVLDGSEENQKKYRIQRNNFVNNSCLRYHFRHSVHNTGFCILCDHMDRLVLAQGKNPIRSVCPHSGEYHTGNLVKTCF